MGARCGEGGAAGPERLARTWRRLAAPTALELAMNAQYKRNPQAAPRRVRALAPERGRKDFTKNVRMASALPA